jgi:hypothetical protein
VVFGTLRHCKGTHTHKINRKGKGKVTSFLSEIVDACALRKKKDQCLVSVESARVCPFLLLVLNYIDLQCSSLVGGESRKQNRSSSADERKTDERKGEIEEKKLRNLVPPSIYIYISSRVNRERRQLQQHIHNYLYIHEEKHF